jgi:transposase
VLGQDPFSGHVFCFRGRRGDLVKLLWWDGDGSCLFAKRLERGRFVWPRAAEGMVVLSRAQLSMLLEGIDWRTAADVAASAGRLSCPAIRLRQIDSAIGLRSYAAVDLIHCERADHARQSARRPHCAEAHHRRDGAGCGDRSGRDRAAEVPAGALPAGRVWPFLGKAGARGRAARTGAGGAGDRPGGAARDGIAGCRCSRRDRGRSTEAGSPPAAATSAQRGSTASSRSRNLRTKQGCGFRGAHVLGTNANPNQPGWNTAQSWKNSKELEEQGRPQVSSAAAGGSPELCRRPARSIGSSQ